MKYKQLIIEKIERLENHLKVVRSGNHSLASREEKQNWEDRIDENIQQIKTLINQNHEE